MDSYITVLKRCLDFKGRSRRREYWMFCVVSFLVAFFLGLLLMLFDRSRQTIEAMLNLYQLIILLPTISVSIRRMHDIGRRGWWILVPLVNLLFCCLDSQPGDNQYGPYPKKAEAGIKQLAEAIKADK